MRKMIFSVAGLCCVLLARAEVSSSVEVKTRIGFAFDCIGVDVMVMDPTGVNGVKVVLKDERGDDVVATQEATLSGNKAMVRFADLKPGCTNTYDVILKTSAGEVVPTGWTRQTVNLFGENVDWFGFEEGTFKWSTSDDEVACYNQAYGAKGDIPGYVTPIAKSLEESNATVVKMRVDVKEVCTWDELPEVPADAQFAFGIALQTGKTEDIPGNRTWAIYSNGAWTPAPLALTTPFPVDNGTYDITLELDYETGRYSCQVAKGGQKSLTVTNPLLDSTTTSLKSVGVLGSGVVSQQVVYQRIHSPVEVLPWKGSFNLAVGSILKTTNIEPGTYSVSDNGFELRWEDDVSDRYVKRDGNVLTFSTGAPANGLKSYDSYALGLDPTKELAKPAAVVKPGGMQTADGVTVHVPNVVPANLPQVSVTVVHQLQRSDDKGRTWTDTGTEVGAGESLVVPFESDVLYRVNTVLK